MVCDLSALAAGSAAQIAIVTDVPDGTANQELRNRAKVTAPQPDPDPSDNARRRDGARVRIDPAFGGAGGGVTG